MEIAVLGIALGKTVCSVSGLYDSDPVVLRKRIQRFRLLDFLAKFPACVVVMEACGGAHHIGRFYLERGHEPQFELAEYDLPGRVLEIFATMSAELCVINEQVEGSGCRNQIQSPEGR